MKVLYICSIHERFSHCIALTVAIQTSPFYSLFF